jgi:cytochrome c-type biogenesis protein CcmH/NrfF
MRYSLLLLLFTTTLFSSTDKDNLVIELEKSLMAPCCYGGTVYDHGHPEMEAEIKALVEAGKTKQEILDLYKERYGERILAIPVAKGFNLMAWVAPVIIAVIGFLIVGLYLKTTKKTPPPPSSESKGKTVPYNDEIEKELKAMDQD